VSTTTVQASDAGQETGSGSVWPKSDCA
jgi:hypothetical protein